MRCDTHLDLDGRHFVVHLAGVLDHTTAATVRHQVRAALDDGPPRVVVDAAELTDIDNAGVGTLCALSRQADAMGGWLRLERLAEPLRPAVAAAADPGSLDLTDRVDVRRHRVLR